MKIWLKSPDPNGKCCACGNSPCSTCCLITGDFKSTVVDVFYGNVYGSKSQGANACTMAGKIAMFQPDSEITSNDIERNFTSSFVSPAFAWSADTNIFENKQISINGSFYTETDVIPRTAVSLTGLSTTWNIDYSYSLSLSATGGLSFSSDNSVFDVFDATYCLENAAKNYQFSYIDKMNFSAVSGDTFTLGGSIISLYRCSQGIGYNTSTSKWTASASCTWPGFDLSVLLRKSVSDSTTGWILFNGNIIGDETFATISKNIFHSTGSVLYEQDVTAPGAADQWCLDNTHSPGITSQQNCFSHLDIFSRAGSCLWAGNFACCTNGGASFVNPTYTTRNGSLQFTFVKNECVEMSLTQLFDMNLVIQDANGNFVNPTSRMVNLTINTGLYQVCNELP